MFNVNVQTDSYGYLTGNFAELKFTAEYEGRTEPVDTSFIFFFGPAAFMKADDKDFPAQLAFNSNTHSSGAEFIRNWEAGKKD